jgi:hypothetical protein
MQLADVILGLNKEKKAIEGLPRIGREFLELAQYSNPNSGQARAKQESQRMRRLSVTKSMLKHQFQK